MTRRLSTFFTALLFYCGVDTEIMGSRLPPKVTARATNGLSFLLHIFWVLMRLVEGQGQIPRQKLFQFCFVHTLTNIRQRHFT